MSGVFPVRDALSGWRLAPDPPPPAAAWPQQVLVMSLIDEITDLPPDPPPSATTATTGLLPRADANGRAGLAGIPLALFPTALSSGAPLQITLDGPGYIAISLTASLSLPAAYPQNFTPVNLDVVALRRAPVTIAGRVVNSSQAALAGAEVAVTGLWPTLASLQNAAPAPANLVASLSPLYAARDVSATVAAVTLAAAAPAKTLVDPGNVGDGSLRLSDQVGLTVGAVLALDSQDSARGEYAMVTAIVQAGLTPQQQASAVLAFPLARPHAAGAVVQPMAATAAGAPNALSRAAQAGDVTLFPAAMGGLDAAMTAILVSGGGPAQDEIHAVALYAAASDAVGHFVLPPLHRVAQIQLRVHSPPLSDLLNIVILPFGAETLDLNLAMT